MNHEQPPDADDLFAALLADYDAALAAGEPLSTPTVPLDPNLQAELHEAQACLQALEQVWPRRTSRPGGPAARSHRPPAAMHLPETLGRFVIQAELGRGGGGVVFRALDPLLGREVALKVPRPEALLTPELRQRFLREAHAAARLDHPNLVPVHEAGEQGPFCYIVSAYCPGPSLRRWLDEHPGPMATSTAVRLVAALAEAVHYIHQRGVLHRDIKPGNVLLAPDSCRPNEPGTPRLTDFGLARLADNGEAQTRTGLVLGTPVYMAPEQAEGRAADVGPATDVYALGVLLYELLAGTPPFRGPTELETMRRLTTDDPPRLPSAVPRDLEALCAKCLEKAPGRRYASARTLADDLGRFLRGEPTAARPLPVPVRAWRWVRGRPATAAVLATATAAVLALVLGAAWHYGQLRSYTTALERSAGREHAQAGEADRLRAVAEDRAGAARRQAYVTKVALVGQLRHDGRTSLMGEQLLRLRPGPDEEDLRGFEWYYLWRLARARPALRGHRGHVAAVAFSPDGTCCASASGDGTVVVWDTEERRPRFTLRAHSRGANAVVFFPDGKLLASGGSDDKRSVVRLWDAADGRPRGTLEPGLDTVVGLAVSADGRTLAAGGWVHGSHTAVVVWDLPGGRERFRRLGPEESRLDALALTPDGRRLASAISWGGWDRPHTISLWDLATGKESKLHRSADEQVTSLSFSPDGQVLACGTRQGWVRRWDVGTKARQKSLSCPGESVWAVAFSPDGRTLATATCPAGDPGRAGKVRLWSADDGRPLRAEPAGSGVGSLAFHPAGHTLALGCVDRLVRLWRLDPPPEYIALPGHAREAWCVAFSPDGRTLVSGSDDETARLWDVASGRERARLEGRPSLVTSAAFSPDGRLLATGSYDGTARLWDPATGKEVRTVSAHQGPVRTLTFSPDGETLATGGDDRAVVLWDSRTGTARHTLRGHANKVRRLAFTPDGRTLASGSNDETIKLWDPATGEERGGWCASHEVHALAYAPDGRTLAVGTRDGLVHLRREDGEEVLHAHVGPVRSLAYSADGRTLATGGEDRLVKLWNTATGEELLTLKGHREAVNGVAFAPDGRALATAAHDGAVWLWPAAEPLR